MITKKLFISHSSKDIIYARKFKTAFEENGVEVWMDEGDLRVGDVLTETFENAIREADFFLLIISENSNNSLWVRKELLFAIRSHTTILPIRIDQSNLFPEIYDHKFLEFSFSNFDDFSFPFNTLLQSMGLVDESILRPTVTNINFYDRDPEKHPDAIPQNIFKKKFFYPRYIYVSWKPKYFYPGLKFTRKWYYNNRIIGKLTRKDIWDNLWEDKNPPNTFIYSRFGHKRGKYHVRFYIGDEIVSGSFIIK